jgi:hypothetical protein
VAGRLGVPRRVDCRAIFAIHSLRKAARREELDRLLIGGLFELPPEPSEAIVRLNAQLAAHFRLPRSEWDSPIPFKDQTLDYASHKPTLPPRQPWPGTFGELTDAISDRVANGGMRLPYFLAARQALADALGRPADSIRWSDRLGALIPPGRQRFIVWERIRSRAPTLPPVDLNPWVENIAIYTFLAALIAIAVPIAQSMDRNEATKIENPSVGTRLVGRALGLILFAAIIAVLMIPVYAIGRRYASRLPKQLDTVGSLAPYAVPTGPQETWTRADVEDHLRDLVAAALHRNPRAIDAATRLS